jgi:hypothetical protein
MAAAAALAAANARIERNMRRGLLSPTTAAQRKARDERAARRTRKREGIPEEPGTPAEEAPVEDVRRAMGGRHRRRHRRSRKTRRRHR